MKSILIFLTLCNSLVLLGAGWIQIQLIGLFFEKQDATQWIELKNNGPEAVDISGWSLQSDASLLFQFSPDTVLEPEMRVRVNLQVGNVAKTDVEGFQVTLAKPWIDETPSSPEEFENFWNEYQLFCNFEDHNAREKIYDSLKNIRDRVPFILKKLFLKSANQEIEDSVLLVNIYRERKRGFHVADLGSYGLAPITILERTEEGFDNIQSLSPPSDFSLEELQLSKLLTIMIEPSYLLWQEKDTNVEIQLATDEAMKDVFWSKSAPVVIGSSLVITPDDRAVLEEHADQPFYCSMKITTGRFTSQVTAVKIPKLDIYNAEELNH